jgi:hypothetical protein
LEVSSRHSFRQQKIVVNFASAPHPGKTDARYKDFFSAENEDISPKTMLVFNIYSE